MNRKNFTFFCSALAFLFFSTNGLAKSNDPGVKPSVSNSKIKTTFPSSAPTPAPVTAQPSKPAKPVPVSVSRPAPAPKPVAPKPAVAQPSKPTKPVPVSVSRPTPTPKPAVVKVKPATGPASLPSAVGRGGLPQAHIPKDLGKSMHVPGSLRGVGQTNSIGGQLPGGHTTPDAGFGKTSGAADLGKGIGQRQGVGSVMEEFSDLTGPVFRTGAGAQRQGQETGEQQYQEQPDEMTFTEEEVAADYAAWERAHNQEHNINKEQKSELGGNTDGEDMLKVMDDNDAKEAGEKKVAKDIKKTKVIAAALEEALGDEERIADGGPGDRSGGPVDPDRMKGMFAGSSGIRFAPGEEPKDGGPVDPGRISEIQSQKNQIHTFEGAIPASLNFEDFSEQAQKNIEAGGPAVRSD